VNRWLPRVTLIVLLLALTASTADAQRRARRRAIGSAPGTRYGLHLGYNFDVDELPLGVQHSLPILLRPAPYSSSGYCIACGGSLWALNFDVKYRPPTRYGAWYVGGGLDLMHASAGGTGGTNSNLNLLTGLEGRRGRTRPYVEARFILGNNTQFQLGGGFSWR